MNTQDFYEKLKRSPLFEEIEITENTNLKQIEGTTPCPS